MSIYLSASSIADFIKCPQKVLYRLKKTVPMVESKAMYVGSAVHLALEKGWNNRDKAQSIGRSEGKSKGLAKADLTNIEFYIDMFFLNFKQYVSDGDLIEHHFKVPLHDDVFLVGKMDRVSKGNIYDWKTGSSFSKKTESDVQCIIYEYAYERLFSKKPASVCIAALGKGEIYPYKRDELYVAEIFNNIIPRMIKTIKNGSYERLGLFNHSCFMCPYRAGCLGGSEEVYELDNTVTPE